MASEVDLIRLRELSVRITKGTTPTKGEGFVARGVNYIKSESITSDGSIDASKFAFIDEKTHDKLARSQLRAGNVLFSMAGVYLGKTAIVLPEHLPANTNQAVGIITLDESKADPHFIHYSLQSPACRAWVMRSAAQSAQPNFNLQEIGDLKIPAFPLAKQKEIGRVLRVLDDRIDNLRQTNATLESIAQALFKSWFIDFDPVRAKAEGRDPEGMDGETAALFPDAFEDSALGAIPKGWVVSEVGSVAQCVGGGTPSTKEAKFWEPAVHHWTTPKDLSGITAPVLLSTERKLSDAGLAKVSSGLLPAGTLLMSSRAPIGYLAISAISVAVNQGYIAMLPGGTLPPIYLYFWCQANMDAIKQKANGSTFMEISKTAFRPISLIVPSAEVIDRFTELAGKLFARITDGERQAHQLAEIRDTLLPRLISGRLRFLEAEAQLNEALA
ncbi:restriction endonuclease subunit S [Trinickia terrae]|uniref:Restriction endonuclease subunit S n=1 Tax=Trinickia terrae TaxID=2571161 RepID=A0A4U1IBA7_9BURK|nr:restriction endonuclease subunit S [Trinickia terrae]TKC90846.1 restriction endonuclease subunit S [Trinickia terrae]